MIRGAKAFADTRPLEERRKRIPNRDSVSQNPAGGSRIFDPLASTLQKSWFSWIQFAGCPESAGIFFSRWSSDSTATRTFSGADLM